MMRSILFALTTGLFASACGGGSEGTKSASGAASSPASGTPSADAKPDDPAKASPSEPTPSDTAPSDTAPSDTAPSESKTSVGDDAKTPPAAEAGEPTDAKADTGGAADAPAAEAGVEAGSGSAAEDTGDAPADPEALLKEAKLKKTKDERALEALTQAETAGAKVRDLAKAANARGLALYATPERAKPFFEWALAKDPKYADPAFNLAKQAVVLGEVEETRKWLTETKARGGKKLVQQVDFDPMWEIVKDDPDVRALLE
jgi:hypothetical protein